MMRGEGKKRRREKREMRRRQECLGLPKSLVRVVSSSSQATEFLQEGVWVRIKERHKGKCRDEIWHAWLDTTS
jgi:hypothetical protein